MMLASHLRDVSVTTALLVVTLMNLIFFTGFLQVTVATDESTPKSASSDGNKHLDNIKLAFLGSMNMALFAKLGSDDLKCNPTILSDCFEKAKKIAEITVDNIEVFEKLFNITLKIEKTSPEKLKKACEGFTEFMECKANKTCQNCIWSVGVYNDIEAISILSIPEVKENCNFTDIKPLCTVKQWKTFHKTPYTGECVPDADKLKCVQKAVPKATDWETGFYSAIKDFNKKLDNKSCSKVLELGKCEVTSGCHQCKDSEETEIEGLFYNWLLHPGLNCTKIPGINDTALKIDCNKVPTPKPTPKPTVTPTPTSSSKTVIIIVVVVVIVLLIIGGIVVYCCFFAGDSGKKKTGGKQGQKVTGKGGAVSGSKMGSDGKSSSVRGGSKSQVGSKLAADSKVGAGKSVS